MTRGADVIVVGLGAMGSAACCQLARHGVRVLGIDRHAPPHQWGSTHGETRITRLAIGEGSEYVPLARRSHELWRELERETGTRLLTQTGIVILGSPASTFLRQTRSSAREYGIEHENLDGEELRSRYPMFAAGGETEAYYEPEGGYVRPEQAVAAQLELARRHGAELLLGDLVERWSASDHGVTVLAGGREHRAARLLLCAGPWIGELFAEGRELFTVYRQLLYWFPVREGYARLRDMPVYVWDLGGDEREIVHLAGFYGFPAIDGPDGGVKVAAEAYEVTAAADSRQHPATPDESARMYERCIAPHLPWLGEAPLRTVSCLYTSTAGSRFVIDRHPDHASVLIVSPCSGHGFKHSPAIGEAVAQWAMGEEPVLDLGPFGLERAAANG